MIIQRITTRMDFEFCSTAFKTRESKDLEYRRSLDRAQILWKLRDREQRADAQNAGQRRHLSSYYLYVCSLVFRLENLPSLISACLKIRNDVVEEELTNSADIEEPGVKIPNQLTMSEMVRIWGNEGSLCFMILKIQWIGIELTRFRWCKMLLNYAMNQSHT